MTVIKGLRIIETDAGVIAADDRVSGTVTGSYVLSVNDEVVNTVAAAGATNTIPAPTTATINYLTLTAACTLTFPTAAAGRSFTLVLKQDGTGSRLVTWPTIDWSGGDTEPTLTTTAAKRDVFTFLCIDGSTWMGFVVGQNV